MQVAERLMFYSSVSETGADGIITAFVSSSDLLALGGRVLQGDPQQHYHSDHLVFTLTVHKPLIGPLSRRDSAFHCTRSTVE